MNKNHTLKALILPVMTVSTLASCNNKNVETKSDYQVIRENYTSNMLKNNSTKTYDGKTVDEIKATLTSTNIADQDTYYFKDIDYTKDQDRSNWPAGGHLGRTLQLTILGEKNNNSEIKDIALKCLYHWVFSNYRNTNWWNNEIGANQNLSNIAMFSFDNLSAKGQAALLGKLYESSLYHRPSLTTHEGSNLLNYCEMTIKCGALDKCSEEIDLAIETAAKTIKQGGVEGYQEDGSFFQHGKLLQTGSYGIEGTVKIANVITMLKGTSKVFPSDKLGIISNYILNGLKSMTHKGYYNYMAIGRAYSRVNALEVETGTYKVSDMKKFTALDNMPNKEDIDRYIEDVTNKTAKESIQGAKAYQDSKILVGNFGDIYMCFKGTDSTMTNTECVNHENCLGYNFSYGQNTAVMQNGKEYYNISPLWDYTNTPGATSRDFSNGGKFDGADSNIINFVQNTLNNGLYEAYLPKTNPNDKSTCIYNIGEENGLGYSMTQSVHDITNENPSGGVEFTSTCFMTDEGMIVLGSGLANKQSGLSDSEKVLHTSLEQCRLYDDEVEPTLSSDKKSVTKGNVIYSSLDDKQLDLQIEERTGNWQRNNPSLSSKEEKGKIMTISLNKNKDINYNSYAYAVQPKDKAGKITVFHNDKNGAAIKLSNGKIAVCFYNENGFKEGGKTYKPDEGKFVPGRGCYKLFDGE